MKGGARAVVLGSMLSVLGFLGMGGGFRRDAVGKGVPSGNRPGFLGLGTMPLPRPPRASKSYHQGLGYSYDRECARRLRQRARDEANRPVRQLKKQAAKALGVSTKGQPDRWVMVDGFVLVRGSDEGRTFSKGIYGS